MSNTLSFVVGNGTNTATLQLSGGVYSFANKLEIRSNSILAGCGTITGNVQLDGGGDVLANCGGTLNFMGAVTISNNASVVATMGTFINFFGPVVNNGLINATNGNVHFYISTNQYQGGGVLLVNNTNSLFSSPGTNSWINGGIGKWETGTNWSAGTPAITQPAILITNANSKVITIDGITTNSPNTLTISNLTVSAPTGTTNTLLLNNAGAVVPLSALTGLTIETNGAVVVNNSVILIQPSSPLYIGNAGGNSALVISNGGAVFGGSGLAGFSSSSGSNSVLVAGTGTVWNNSSNLLIGVAGSSNSLTITNNASVIASNACIGLSAPSAGNQINVAGGGLYVTNEPLNGVLEVRRGLLALNSGTVSVNELMLTNGLNSVIGFAGGTLNSGGTFVTNNQVFFVGNGTNPATFNAQSGVHSFAYNLEIQSNAVLAGCGTITGSVRVDNGGAILGNCGGGGTLYFAGTVTNNGSVGDLNGTIINFNGLVVNNGAINNTNGNVRFNGGLTNHGIIMINNSWTCGACSYNNGDVGKWETAGNWSASVPTNGQSIFITNPTGPYYAVTIDNVTTASAASNLTVNTLALSAASFTLTTLSLTNMGLSLPLVIQNGVTVGSGGLIEVSDSLLEVDEIGGLSPYEGVYVGVSGADNSLTIANGGAVSNLYGFLAYNSSSSNNAVLVSGTSSVWSNVGLYVGWSGGGNTLTITNHGAVFDSSICWVGVHGGNNMVSVSGSGSVWNNNVLLFGWNTSGNQLTISGGGLVIASNATVGLYYDGNNGATVTDNGSVWTNSGSLAIGSVAPYSSLTVSNGGKVFSATGVLGDDPTWGWYNTASVTGSGSVWRVSQNLVVGTYGQYNELSVLDSGVVSDATGYIGTNSTAYGNSVMVIGSGSVWSNTSSLYVGYSGTDNYMYVESSGSVVASNLYVGYSGADSQLVVQNGGSVVASSMIIGANAGAVGYLDIYIGGNLAVVGSNMVVGANAGAEGVVAVDSSGNLVVTNASGTAQLVVGNGGIGNFLLNGGSVTVNQLVATNGPNSVFTFDAGALNSGGTFVTNGQGFVVGDGFDVATFQLINSGVHSFFNDLEIRAHCFLAGCGTINGSVIVDSGGTVLANCGVGGTLYFAGSVTNNGTIVATNGTSIVFSGPVINNGVINTTNGNVQFFSPMQGNGTLLSNGTNSWIDGGSGKWEMGTNWSAGQPLSTQPAEYITNANSKTVTIDAITVHAPSAMTISNLTVSGVGGATNTLAITNAGAATPLVVLNTLTLGTGGVMVVSNSAVVAGAVGNAGTIQANAGTLTIIGGTTTSLNTTLLNPTLTTFYSFNFTNGEAPAGGVVQGSDGNFYGTTEDGGIFYSGTVFRISPAADIHDAVSVWGRHTPRITSCGLVQGSDGNFYGTTFDGGANNDGTVFRISPVGTLTTLFQFGGANGTCPRAGLVQGSDGNFYGTTSSGGTNNDGTVFRISSVGTLTTLFHLAAPTAKTLLGGWCRAAMAISTARLRPAGRTMRARCFGSVRQGH